MTTTSTKTTSFLFLKAILALALSSNVFVTEAFSPLSPPSGTPSTTVLYAVVTGPNGKAASSKEEDLKLTFDLIMNFVDGGNEGSSVAEDAPPKKQKKKKKKSNGENAQQPAEAPDMDVSKLDIRVGVINKAWEHEEADKLFCEEIDIGEEGGARQIASGLRAHYSADDLSGRKVLVLANLKKRKLVGFPSHGMVLCASTDDGKVVFVDPPADAEVGTLVTCPGFEGEPASENQVGKKKILDKVLPDLKTNDDGVACYKGVPLQCGPSGGSCVAQGELSNAKVS
mmetsp:Transcript_37684/g.91667  ORF Transcript_37684/g.91667 Transcript_37684/m.91667 type:complete len:284 (+) Transcript_37684:18-869(+)